MKLLEATTTRPSRLLASALFIAVGCAQAPADQGGSDNIRYGTRVHKMPMSATAPSNGSAPAGAHLTYYGGRVVSNMQVVQVLYGTGSYLPQVQSTTSPSMATFYQGILNSPYVDMFSEYNTPSSGGTNQHIGRGSFLRQVTITPSAANNGATIDDTNIQAEIAAQISAGHLPAPTTDAAGNNNTYYAVFFPHGKVITQGGSGSCSAFCAYHGTIANAAGHEVYYGVHPDMQAGSGCESGCGSSPTSFQNYTSVASHEMSETITDCEVGLATTSGPPLAWYDNTNGENGDICNAQQGPMTGGDGVTYTVQAEFSNLANDCIYSRGTTAGNDFSLAASSSSMTVSSGSSGTDAITTAVTSGSAESIALSASGAPAGVTLSLSPTSVSSGGSSTLTVTASSTAAAGTYSITVTGSAASGSHSATISLTITSTTTTNDFSVSASPASLSLAPGASGSSSIATAVTAGKAQTVSFSASGQPAGVTVSFSPASVTAGSSATATIAASSSAAAGTYAISVTGTGTSASHSANISLTISGGSGGGSGITNGGFESGFTGWTTSGTATIASSGCHGGSSCAQLGSTSPTSGDSSAVQTFTAAAGTTGISLFYKETCPDSVTYDWALATLKDNTAGTSATLIAKACATNAWTNATGAVTAGHSYTLTLTSHDDNYSGDATYTLFDDVSLTSSGGGGGGGITNGGFESGFSGWTTAGTATAVTSGCHGGAECARLGSTSPTNGDSSAAQTFTVPSGKSQLSAWYQISCPDTLTYDWATITLKNNATGATTTVLPKTCNSGSWTNVTASVSAGASYTLTLTSHDDNYSSDPTYTLFDDVTLN
jgi:hypothetical protein